MLQSIQLQVNYENAKKKKKKAMKEGGDQPWAPITQDQYSSRRNEIERRGRKLRLSLYPEIALHKGHLKILAKTALWPC